MINDDYFLIKSRSKMEREHRLNFTCRRRSNKEQKKKKSFLYFSLTEDHKRMIRCVRKIQLIVAQNRFQVNRSVCID